MRPTIIYTVLLVLLTGAASYALDGGTESPFEFGTGARELALGGADLSFTDPTTAPFWLPAALSRTEHYSLSGFHCRLFDSDVAYQYVGLAIPTLDWGTVGFGLFRLGVDGIEKRDVYNTFIEEISDDRLGFYAAYGRRVSGYDLGLAITFEHHSLDTYKATSSPGLNLSAGRVIDINGGFVKRVGIAAQARNAIRPGMELAEEKIKLPFTADVGISTLVSPGGAGDHLLMVAAKLTKVDKQDPVFSAGLEYSLAELISLRGGVRDKALAAGGGVRYKGFQFDYALVDRDLGSIHTVNLTMAFGTPVSVRKAQRTARREAEFNERMSRRLLERNQTIVTELMTSGSDMFDKEHYTEAANLFDRALFLARSSGLDTSRIINQVESARLKVQELSRSRMVAAYLDSANIHMEQRDYLGARHFAQQALSYQADSNEAQRIVQLADNAITSSMSKESMISKQVATIDSLLTYGRADRALDLATDLLDYAPYDDRVQSLHKKARFEHWKTRAANAYERADYPATLHALDTALAIYPGHTWCLDLQKRAKSEQTRGTAPEATAPEPAPLTLSPELRREVDESYQTGKRFFENGQLSEAIQVWERVQRMAPGYQSVTEYLVKAYKFVGVEMYSQNRLADAIDVWTKAAALDPNNEEIKNYIQRSENEIRRLKELSYGN